MRRIWKSDAPIQRILDWLFAVPAWVSVPPPPPETMLGGEVIRARREAVRLAGKAERERCAKACETLGQRMVEQGIHTVDVNQAAKIFAASIRGTAHPEVQRQVDLGHML